MAASKATRTRGLPHAVDGHPDAALPILLALSIPEQGDGCARAGFGVGFRIVEHRLGVLFAKGRGAVARVPAQQMNQPPLPLGEALVATPEDLPAAPSSLPIVRPGLSDPVRERVVQSRVVGVQGDAHRGPMSPMQDQAPRASLDGRELSEAHIEAPAGDASSQPIGSGDDLPTHSASGPTGGEVGPEEEGHGRGQIQRGALELHGDEQ